MKHQHLCLTDEISISNGWTPIMMETLILDASKSNIWQIERTQFQLVECEAMTIHKSQGLTFEKVAVQLSFLTRQLRYVAFSRVTHLKGLYLFGDHSIVPKSKKKSSKDSINYGLMELNRMRKNCRMDNFFPFLEDNRFVPTLKIMFFNCNHYSNDRKYWLENERLFNTCDLILLSETHCTNPNGMHYKDYRTLVATGSAHTNGSHGQAAFFKSLNLVEIVSGEHNADQGNHLYVDKHMTEIIMVQIKTFIRLYVICVYKHPKCSEEDMIKELAKFFKKHVPTGAYFVLVGDLKKNASFCVGLG